MTRRLTRTVPVSDLRWRIHPQRDGLHGRRAAPHPVERHAVHVQGKRAAEQAAAQAVAAAVDGRLPDRDDSRRDRPSRGQRQQPEQKLAGRAARAQQRRRRRRCTAAIRRRLSACRRHRPTASGARRGRGRGLVRASVTGASATANTAY